MKRLELPIFWHTDETAQFDELNIDYKMSDCKIRRITFFNISAVCPCNGDTDEENDKYTKIFSNGTTFICKTECKEVISLIETYL